MNFWLSRTGAEGMMYISYAVDRIINIIEVETDRKVVTIDDFDKGLVLFKK